MFVLNEFTKTGLSTGGENIKADYIPAETFKLILVALMPENRLALLTSLCTGLRIDDVLSIKTEQLKKDALSVREMKTGKRKRVRLPKDLKDELFTIAGRFYVFEHRLDVRKHRTRQAVNKDLVRACNALRIKGVNITPHTARKIYAVKMFDRTSSLERVRQALNHSKNEITLLYANADIITEKETKCKRVSLPNF